MKTIGMGLVGPGFVGAHHIDSVRRLGYVDVVAIAGSSAESTARKAKQLNVDRAYGSFQELVDDPNVQVIHNTTPNHLHYPVTLAALKAGKHVISDKPLALSAEEARLLLEAAHTAGVAHVVTFNYRGNPLVQQARGMVASGELGKISFVHGFYLQDWMTDPGVYSWRLDSEKGGVSSALADIGSHWCDLAEHVSGSRIQSVLAELTTVVDSRYASAGSAEASAQTKNEQAERISVSGEDLASVLLRFENGAKGCFSVGQVLPGHKNNLQLQINGAACSVGWQQENQNELWIGYQNQSNRRLAKDPSLMSVAARKYAHLPGGHQEAWADAFTNVMRDAYDWISNGGAPSEKPGALATFTDGYRAHLLIEAMIKSHRDGGRWTEVS
ncbi:Gfo/Idh/MocA family protein [Tunturiibacter gelidiferens]|uniref:Gfo/Idh/MocA family protein n=1 Tax=Tunturiibacter gelidiferens TaxID=3069689 RepID=UPI003D9AC2A0